MEKKEVENPPLFIYNKIFVFFGDMCLEKYSYEFRNLGQDRRSRTRLARANETLKRPIENRVFSIESVSDLCDLRRYA